MNQRRRILKAVPAALMASGLTAPTHVFGQTPAPQARNDRQAYNWLDRADVRLFLADLAKRHKMPIDWLERQVRPLGMQPRALMLMNPPPPGPDEPVRKRSWAKYLSQHADQSRIQEGREFMRRHQRVLKRASEQSGVPPSVMAAIIGVETKYGKFTGRFPTFETLMTLGFESPRRAEFFRSELEALLLMGYQGLFDISRVQGSFAGALGIPQFMPSSWRNFALAHEDKTQPDLLNNFEDAIVSVGNFLKHHGWREGAPSHSPALIGQNASAPKFLAPKLEPIHTVAELRAAGIEQREPRLTPETPASLIDLPEADDTVQYWIAAHNFFVVTQYNRSFMYAAAVLTLSEQLSA